MQGISSSLSGLGLYSQQQDVYSHMLPATTALLDGSTASDPYMNAGLMSNMHAMHAAAALQQVGSGLKGCKTCCQGLFEVLC